MGLTETDIAEIDALLGTPSLGLGQFSLVQGQSCLR